MPEENLLLRATGEVANAGGGQFIWPPSPSNKGFHLSWNLLLTIDANFFHVGLLAPVGSISLEQGGMTEMPNRPPRQQQESRPIDSRSS
jgi:hypothetical protein